MSSGDPTFENMGGTYLSKHFSSTPVGYCESLVRYDFQNIPTILAWFLQNALKRSDNFNPMQKNGTFSLFDTSVNGNLTCFLNESNLGRKLQREWHKTLWLSHLPSRSIFPACPGVNSSAWFGEILPLNISIQFDYFGVVKSSNLG